MPDLNLDLDYFGHPQTRRLVGLLGRGADVLPIKLWCYCGKYHAEDGRLLNHSTQEIESVIEWRGQQGKAVEAMLEVGFLEKEGDTYVIHNWNKRQGHIHAIGLHVRAMAKARWDKAREKAKPQGNIDASSNAGSNAETPSQQCTDRPTDRPTEKKPPRRPPKGGGPGVESSVNGSGFRRFTDHWCQRKREESPAYKFTKADGTLLAAVWERTSEDADLACRAVDAYMADRKDFYEGHPSTKFKMDAEKFITRASMPGGINGNHKPTASERGQYPEAAGGLPEFGARRAV